MKSPGKYHVIAFIWLWITLMGSGLAVGQQLWSEVKFNKASVYPGEPMEVSVSVFTSTWFTAGVDPGNVKVNGAYTVFFRNVSTSRQQGGKTFSGVQMIFNVFPSSGEDVIFPTLSIEVETPPEGGYQGVKRTVKTKERIIKVRPIPPGFSQVDWLVSTNVSVRQNWSGDLKNIKVGDVVSRTITRTVSNTVSQLIPPVSWDSLAGVSMYPARSSVESNRSKTAISATRTESMRYLFEKEGEVVFPEMEFTWWNPYHQKLYKRTLPEVRVEVQPNPDLGMLASIRDSLQAEIAATQAAEEEADKYITILGMSLKDFLTLAIAVVLIVVALILLLRWTVRYRKKYLQRYRNSEKYFWRKLQRASRSGNAAGISTAMYLWLDHLKLKQPTARYFAERYGDESLKKEVMEIERKIALRQVPKINLANWRKARSRYLKGNRPIQPASNWINP